MSILTANQLLTRLAVVRNSILGDHIFAHSSSVGSGSAVQRMWYLWGLWHPQGQAPTAYLRVHREEKATRDRCRRRAQTAYPLWQDFLRPPGRHPRVPRVLRCVVIDLAFCLRVDIGLNIIECDDWPLWRSGLLVLLIHQGESLKPPFCIHENTYHVEGPLPDLGGSPGGAEGVQGVCFETFVD